MENGESYLEFITSENYKQQIDIWYKAYNISREKTELFYDFIVSLYELIDNTYLGSDVINTEEDQRNHFNWCWDKTIDSYNKEKIFIKERDSAYQYFWNFFSEAYYYMQHTDTAIRINDYFKILFSFKHRKSRSELDMLTEIYKLLEQNLKK
ncbi:hypothetical protein [Flavobacterium sp.]|uniref:hypothetical protein n=1 Tax=Flavobacterium sp. TaxID=239 RepID=UPI0038CF5BA4